MSVDGIARLGHGVARRISRREAAGQIGDAAAEGVLVAAGFNCDGVIHACDSCFKLGLFPGIPEHARRPARQWRRMQFHICAETDGQQARPAV